MTVDEHRAKAECIERSLSRCTPGDYETIIEACMLAGTHWFNIALHETRLMPFDHDAMHAEFLSGADRRKARLLVPAALAALDEIEALRTPHVRGDLDGGERGRATRARMPLRAQRQRHASRTRADAIRHARDQSTRHGHTPRADVCEGAGQRSVLLGAASLMIAG